jgi:hypothetical protein
MLEPAIWKMLLVFSLFPLFGPVAWPGRVKPGRAMAGCVGPLQAGPCPTVMAWTRLVTLIMATLISQFFQFKNVNQEQPRSFISGTVHIVK